MQSYNIMKLYPLFFTPLFKYRLWGGTKLRTVLHKEFDGDQTSAILTPWTDQEVLEHLEAGWGAGAIFDLELQFLFQGEPEVSG